MKMLIVNWIYRNLSQGPDKDERNVPGDWLKCEFGPDDEKVDGVPMHSAYTSNDGFELWLAYTRGGDGWLAHYDAPSARQLAWFILWDWWAKATWFGLRRKLWYWALHERLMAQDWYRERYGSK